MMRRILTTVILSLVAVWFSRSLGGQEPAVRPPITGITHVRLWSADPPKSLDFYSKVLGLIPRDAGCAGTVRPCYLVSEHQQIALARTTFGSRANLLAEVAFATGDAVSMHRYLQAHNVAVSVVTRDFNGTVHFSLLDPAGLPVVFVQAPLHHQLTSTPGQVSTRLIHAGFVVHDRIAEDKFYKDLLGFRVYWHGGMKDGETDWVDMQVPDGTDWLEYMLSVSPTADKKELGVMNHIALGVPDIKAAREQLLKNGWKPGEDPQVGRDGKWQLNLYDPDDTRVELMEFTPVQKPCCSDYAGPHPKP
jgi:catechol 2,3-dioxygenase-like lactoylglutathione lyase family enzyme